MIIRPTNLVACALLASLAGSGTARAQLRWERTEVQFEASAAEQQVVGVFPFSNVGSVPVRIESVKTGCGCTVVKLGRNVIPPGESDRLIATFVFGGRKGEQRKTIVVQTDDPRSSVKLALSGTIRELAQVRPTFLYWKVGEPALSKVSAVRIVHDRPIRIVRAVSATGGFRVGLREVDAGRQYEIEVTPSGTAEQALGRIDLFCDLPGRAEPLVYIHARVR